jgi:ketosteroid isomerase-like protein
MPDEYTLVQFFDFINNRDLAQMEDLLTETAEFYFPKTQPLLGRRQIVRFFKILFHRYPELSFQIEEIIIQENRAAVHWKNHGFNRRREPYENEGVTILEEEGGRISFMSDFFKDTEKF